jgi:hypothetical protein
LIDHFVERNFALEPAGLNFLLDRSGDAGVENAAVERKGVAVLVVSGRRLGGVEPDVFSQRPNAVFPVLAGVLDAALIGAQESARLLLFSGATPRGR